jgi:hypothetical protein
VPYLRNRCWLALTISIATVISGSFTGVAAAGDHHRHATKYDVVQAYILQTSPTAQPASAICQPQSVTPASNVASASPQTLGVTASAPPTPAPATPQVAVASSPPQASPVNVQMVAAPVQTVQVSFVQAAPTVQYVPVAAAPAQVQYVAVQMAQAPAVSAAAPVQFATQNQVAATPVQLLIPHKTCHLFSHLFGH